MGYRTLIETWVGMSWEEITDNWKPPAKKEDYEAAVEGEKNKLANAILEGIIKRAQAGKLDAVNWLEERGLLKLPSREVSKASKAAIESGVSQEELREAEELQPAIDKKIMENSVKFSKAQHESESLKVKGFSGLHFVEIAGEGKNPETKKPYSYGVDTAKTKTQLKSRMSSLVDYSVAKGNSEEDAIAEVIKNVNHARNINQRQPFRPSASKLPARQPDRMGQRHPLPRPQLILSRRSPSRKRLTSLLRKPTTPEWPARPLGG